MQMHEDTTRGSRRLQGIAEDGDGEVEVAEGDEGRSGGFIGEKTTMGEQ